MQTSVASLLQSGLVEDNDYFRAYCDLIENNLTTSKQKFKTQCHHIIPRSYYQHAKLEVNNDPSNLVNLTHSDHLKAHYLLFFCAIPTWFKENCGSALYRMSAWFPENIGELLPRYQELMEQTCKLKSERSKGRPVSEEARQKMSEAKKLYYATHECPLKGIPKNPEHIAKMKATKKAQNLHSTLGRVWVTNERENHLLPPDEAELFLSKHQDWRLGHVKYEGVGAKISASLQGQKHSKERTEKSAAGHRGKIFVNNGYECRLISPMQYAEYVQIGYKKGLLKKKN